MSGIGDDDVEDEDVAPGDIGECPTEDDQVPRTANKSRFGSDVGRGMARIPLVLDRSCCCCITCWNGCVPDV